MMSRYFSKLNMSDEFTTIINMHLESERIKTFTNWPLTFLSPETLAKNGFYYLQRGDEVRCAFCKVEIMQWKEGDDPGEDHKKWASKCPFLVDQHKIPGPIHPKYLSEIKRLKTFKNWPQSLKQTPEELAEAGFYYTNCGDKVKCFYCDLGLKDWENNDIVWEQHARWAQKCNYVSLVKGEEYIQQVISNAHIVKDNSDEYVNNINNTQLSNICIICLNKPANITFIPCGHISCLNCYANLNNTCHMCRSFITKYQKIYFN
ncbi:inhibitor of apoptosis 3 [Choristoneura rosaceana entomopoxvirus 'L']|uniref:Inhibitor of apoptosis 3 n=1 Tax=Choristoneura rosaceana entomopoxvirus 'L' TaxID=1293539 RepID=A0ABM9QKG7_9POXV|nr:inhibitor of apoptosis 3 [Choristoneura rosaceana entomopoxvirus 'L']CCU56005.1 inhibitor of apoptosis 3 [Choristoneura rosaceana entomopoxvirus 'L']